MVAKRLIITTLIIILVCLTAFSNNSKPSIKTLIISGTVKDKNNHEALEYATIGAYQKSDSSILGGTITNNQGKFQLEIKSDDFFIKISYLGYTDLIIDQFQIKNRSVNLNTLYLSTSHTSLNEVTIVAEKSHTVFKLDKRVFNVGKDLLNSGGTALDVLNNVPSVDVNIQGTISLRGNSNIQILINGKPSVMTSGNGNVMGTITADMIDRVEVITNPSAKYDAEGTTGIINIILKKEEKKGLNGSFTVNTGIPNNHSIGISLNRRTDKFNIFSQVGAGKRTFLSEIESVTENKNIGEEQELRSKGNGEKTEQFYNLILGTDYHINKLNVLTLSGHVGYEFEDETSDINYIHNPMGEDDYTSSRQETTYAENPKWEYELQYKKDFRDKEDHQLLVRAIGSYFGKDQSSDYFNTSVDNTDENFSQKSINDFSEAEYTFQADYENPFSETVILEAGVKYEIGNLSSDYKVEDLQSDNWIVNTNYTNLFKFRNDILAAYATYAFEKEKWGIKGGLRIENTWLSTELKTNNIKNITEYLDFFPSFHTSYKLTEKLSMQLGYSRRIHRPHMDDLNPFESLSDNKNIYSGNPDLKPEYTHSYELNLIQSMDKISLNGALFHRRTSDVVDEITRIEGNVSYTTPYNIGSSYNTGIDFNGKFEASKFLSFSTNAYWTYYNRQGEYNNQNFNFNSSVWAARATAKIKFPHKLDMDMRFRYKSKYKGILAEEKEYYYLDLGIKKKIFKGRGIINFSVQDVFNSRTYISESNQPDYYFYERHKRGSRFILGFSFGFGKGEAMEFSGQKMF